MHSSSLIPVEGNSNLSRDPKTGAYSTKTVGFSNAPAITLPQLGVTEVAKDATTTKKEADNIFKNTYLMYYVIPQIRNNLENE